MDITETTPKQQQSTLCSQPTDRAASPSDRGSSLLGLVLRANLAKKDRTSILKEIQPIFNYPI